MLQRDYFLRLLEEFAAALSRFLELPIGNRRDNALKDLYNQYIGDYDFYHTAAVSDVIESMEQHPEDQRVSRLEMLAELYYVESQQLLGAEKLMMCQKAYDLFKWVNERDTTYSVSRLMKIKELSSKIS